MGNYLFCNYYLFSFEVYCIWYQIIEIESLSLNWILVY